ncbi:MFS transporter [Mesorhizobium sp. KR2-14]|uniref:MFS transporter n=1 Tax=Mesorhizobium sp. KR2-14 TaxID=3156610 RepID=UPI0032B45420
MNDSRIRLATIAALLLAGVLAGTQLGKIAPLVDWYRSEAGFSLVLIGWLTSMISIFVALVALPTGWAIERAGMRRSFIASAVVMTAGGLALAFLDDPAAILVARLVEGIGYLVLVIVIPALLNTIAPPAWRAPALAIWGGFVPVGFAVADFMARGILPTAEPQLFLLAAIVAFALFALIGAVLLAMVGDADAGSETQAAAPTTGGLAAQLTFPVALVALSFGFYVVLSVSFFAFTPAFVALPQANIALSAGLIALIVPIGNVLTGVLVKGRDGRFVLMLAGVGFAASLVAAVPTFGGSAPALATAAAVVIAIAGGIIASALFASIPAIVPQGKSASIAIGLVCQAGGIGTVIGPPLAGYVIEAHGWAGFGVFLALTAAIGGLCLLPLARSQPRGPEAVHAG